MRLRRRSECVLMVRVRQNVCSLRVELSLLRQEASPSYCQSYGQQGDGTCMVGRALLVLEELRIRQSNRTFLAEGETRRRAKRRDSQCVTLLLVPVKSVLNRVRAHLPILHRSLADRKCESLLTRCAFEKVTAEKDEQPRLPCKPFLLPVQYSIEFYAHQPKQEPETAYAAYAACTAYCTMNQSHAKVASKSRDSAEYAHSGGPKWPEVPCSSDGGVTVVRSSRSQVPGPRNTVTHTHTQMRTMTTRNSCGVLRGRTNTKL